MIIGPIEKINCETAHSGRLCADYCRKTVCMCSIFTRFEAEIVPIEKKVKLRTVARYALTTAAKMFVCV